MNNRLLLLSYWLRRAELELMTAQRHLLDSLPLEGHEAAGECRVDAGKVCLRDV